MPKSTRNPADRKAARPPKPYPDFPLSPHASGAWQKKIRGKIHYFGKWGRVVDGVLTRVPGDGWEEALAAYMRVADDLHAGRTPRPGADALTVADLCNHFLTAKHARLEAGEIAARTFSEYKATTDRLVSAFGKGRRADDLRPDDFARLRASLAKQYGPVRLGNEVQKARTVFKFAADNGLTDRAVRFGSEFKKPARTMMRLHNAKVGKKLFTADEVRRLHGAAGVQLRAMVLLGANCGFGNADCGTLPLAAVDLDAGWVEFPRPKTGVPRRGPLWPETVAALRTALAARPTPKDEQAAPLVFITKFGRSWMAAGTSWPLAQAFGKLLRKLGIARRGVAFYSLRHTFRTVADATKDPNAIRTIMGHTDDSIDANYTHGIADDRLRAVADHVRAWLFPPAVANATTGPRDNAATGGG